MNNPGGRSGTVGTPASAQVTASDSAGEALTYGGTLPPGLAIDPASGLIWGTPATAGTFQSSVAATDTSGHSGSAAVTWTIRPRSVVTVNNPGDQTRQRGDTVSLPITATDSAGEALTYSGTLPPGWPSTRPAA